MKIKTPINARKLPRQKRSRETVEVILTATARVLVKEGYDAASTNRIADIAGVSIGSLYQYFPNKEALITALIEQHNNEIIEMVRSKLILLQNESLAEVVAALVSGAFEAHRISPELHKVFVEQIPRVGQFEQAMIVEVQITEIIYNYFQTKREQIRPHNLHLAAFIAVQTVEALTHAAINQTIFSEINQVKREITEMLLHYLTT